MTAYLGDKPVSIGGVRATEAVVGKVLHDKTLNGDGFQEPLGVDTNVMATTEYVRAREEAIREDITKNEDCVKKSGDSMTGDLVIDGHDAPSVGPEIKFVGLGANPSYGQEFMTTIGTFRGAHLSIKQYLNGDVQEVLNFNDGFWGYSYINDKMLNSGTALYPWKTTYTQILNAGNKVVGDASSEFSGDLIVPNEGGTLARLEDIDAIGGDGTTGQVLTKTDEGMAWQDASGGTGGGGGDCLPLSGGTLTGELGINTKGYNDHPVLVDAYNELQIGYNSYITGSFITVFRFKLGDGTFLPYSNNLATLGDSTRIWKTAFVANLNNGADLIVPTEGGTLARLEDLEGLGGGDYLPLAGGEMSGPIAFSGTDYSIKYDASKYGLVIYTSATRCFVFSNSGYGTFFSTSSNPDLGQTGYKWRRVYARIINNGADLNVPTVGGTIARIEDIDAVVGDISTALTAILGE